MFLLVCLLLIASFLLVIRRSCKPKRKAKHFYDSRGFGQNRIHKNGTMFDDYGYDYFGYDANGYNKNGYNKLGKNRKGQYNRFFDTKSCEEEGFYSPKLYCVNLSPHARKRMQERLGINDYRQMHIQTVDAYRYGKSKRQIKKSSAYLIEEMEQRHDNSVILIYKNIIYVFSHDNVLKTVFRNDKIPL